VAAITDDEGRLLDQQRYEARPSSGAPGRFGAERPNVGSITETDFGYTGQPLRLWAQGRAMAAGCRLARRDLAGVGLMDYKARMYDSSIGRFIQPDTIIPNPADPQSWDRYSYVFNKPLLFVDPTGHFGQLKDEKSDYWNDRNQEKVRQLEDKWEKEKAHKGLKQLLQATDKEIALDPMLGPAGAFGGGKPLFSMVAEGGPPPVGERLSTALFMMPLFLALDLGLVAGTLVVSAALAADPEPITKAALLLTEIGICALDVGVVYAEVSYVHWIVTGTGIDSWSDLEDWQVRP
jgi:RHS repeat-associated protein